MGNDTGIGAELGSPSFFKNRIQLRFSGSVMWHEDCKALYDHWGKYNVLNALVAYNLRTRERYRPYVEVGTTYVFPSDKISDSGNVQGINLAGGLELFLAGNPRSRVCYYINLGVSHIRAYADQLEGEPRYADGFFFRTGFRLYL